MCNYPGVSDVQEFCGMVALVCGLYVVCNCGIGLLNCSRGRHAKSVGAPIFQPSCKFIVWAVPDNFVIHHFRDANSTCHRLRIESRPECWCDRESKWAILRCYKHVCINPIDELSGHCLADSLSQFQNRRRTHVKQPGCFQRANSASADSHDDCLCQLVTVPRKERVVEVSAASLLFIC